MALNKKLFYHHIRNHEVACECFEIEALVKQSSNIYLQSIIFLINPNIPFDDLFEWRCLRYDFTILKDNKAIALIEFDGQQHYQVAGSYYNPTGKVQIHDNRKDDYAVEHNIPL